MFVDFNLNALKLLDKIVFFSLTFQITLKKQLDKEMWISTGRFHKIPRFSKIMLRSGYNHVKFRDVYFSLVAGVCTLLRVVTLWVQVDKMLEIK